MKIFKFIKFFIKILFLKTVVKSKDKKNDKLILIEIDKCNFCNSKNLNLLYSYKCKIYNYIFNVFECISCGHGFIGNPPNSNTLIEKYYSYDANIYYSRDAITMSPEDRSIEQSFNQMMDEKREKKIKNLNNQNKEKFKIIEKYIEEYKEYKSVLEIGCMHGEFLNFLEKKNYNVKGVDIIDNPLFLNKEKYIKANFEKIKLNQKFDLILSFANIEHVYDPKGYLLKCKELLTKNGRIIIQSVNFKSPSSRKLYQEDIPFHLNFFNIKCLEDFCNAHNLEIKKKIFNTKLYHDYSEGYFVERILSFFGKKYSQELRDECGFNTPYKDINRLLTYKYSFTKFRYKILFLLDYTLNKITKIKLNYQFIVILKNKF